MSWWYELHLTVNSFYCSFASVNHRLEGNPLVSSTAFVMLMSWWYELHLTVNSLFTAVSLVLTTVLKVNVRVIHRMCVVDELVIRTACNWNEFFVLISLWKGGGSLGGEVGGLIFCIGEWYVVLNYSRWVLVRWEGCEERMSRNYGKGSVCRRLVGCWRGR